VGVDPLGDAGEHGDMLRFFLRAVSTLVQGLVERSESSTVSTTPNPNKPSGIRAGREDSMKEPWSWDEADLQRLVATGTKESLTLDYKASAALANTDGKKNEVSKDVSAFANSAGGTIVYGIVEKDHLPVCLDHGFDPTDITREWLESVINSRIQRRIDGVRISAVDLRSTSPGRVAYVVSVPQSNRAPHQAHDKKFYKRFEFESVPMEEYEIRDVARRGSVPDLSAWFVLAPGPEWSGDAARPGTASPPVDSLVREVPLTFADGAEFSNPVPLAIVMTNTASAPAHFVRAEVMLDESVRIRDPADFSLRGVRNDLLVGQNAPLQHLVWDLVSPPNLPVFEGYFPRVGGRLVSIAVRQRAGLYSLVCMLRAPGMEARGVAAVLQCTGASLKIMNAPQPVVS